MKNFRIMIWILCGVGCFSGMQSLYGQKPQPAAPQPSTNNTQQAKQQVPLKENEYRFIYPNGYEGRVIDTYTIEDSIRINHAIRHGKKKEYDEIYDVLLRSFLKKDKVVQTQYASILNKIGFKYALDPQYYRQAAWQLAVNGYNLALIEEFQQKASINVLELAIKPSVNYKLSMILFSNLIVIGTIDSTYRDDTPNDGYQASSRYNTFTVQVKEVLKGDTTIKRVIGRVNSRITPHFQPDDKKEYLLFLYKNDYEYAAQRHAKAKNINLRSDPENKGKGQDFYTTYTTNLRITPQLSEYELKRQPASIQEWNRKTYRDAVEIPLAEVRKLCSDLKSLLQKTGKQ